MRRMPERREEVHRKNYSGETCQRSSGDHQTMYMALGVNSAAFQTAPPPRFGEDQPRSFTTHPQEMQLTMQVGLGYF